MSSDLPETEELTFEQELEDAKRSFALKEWSQAADAYGQVLESLREAHDEEAPLFAPVFHRYGHALLEHAIATSGALGGGGGSKDAFVPDAKPIGSGKAKEAGADQSASKSDQASSSAIASSSKGEKKATHDPRFTFGGDAEDSDEEEEAVAAPTKGDDDDDDDDLSLAFSILELARVRYEKILESGETATLKTVEGDEWSAVMIKSQLAEVLNDLADVGLESENFQQASADYKSSLEMLTPLLQPHSRRLADAYLRLGLALEFHPDASLQASAEKYVRGACKTLEQRLESLQGRQRVLDKEKESGEIGLAKAEAAASEIRTEKAEIESVKRLAEDGLLKEGAAEADSSTALLAAAAATGSNQLFEKDNVATMDSEQVEKEQKDVQEIIQELRLKIEEYNSAANAAPGSDATSSLGSSKEKLQQAINEALLGSSTNALGAPPLNPNAPVNDLSAMVKKKKKPEESNENGKRKEPGSDETVSEQVNGKKVKVD